MKVIKLTSTFFIRLLFFLSSNQLFLFMMVSRSESTTTTSATTQTPPTTVGPGGTCRGDTCAGNMTCVNMTAGGMGVCGCNASYYPDKTNCLTRLGYSESCTKDIMCQANFRCSGPDSGKKCSCPPDTFRDGTSCKNKNTLAVTITQNGDYMETGVRVQWTQPTTGNTVRYTAVLGSDTKGNSTDNSTTFDKLTPGTEYSVNVTTYIQKETFESDSIGFTSTQKVFTKPAQPGQLVQDTYVGTNSTQGGRDVTIEFYSSEGRVESYTVNIRQPHQMGTNVKMNQSVVSASFTTLTPDTMYTVTITAESNNIISAVRTGSFRVPVTLAGKVFQLTVSEIGSRSVRVTWKKPANPNGVIQGYTVRVTRLGNSSCVAGVSVRCSNNYTCNNTLQNKPNTSDCIADLPEIMKTSAELNNTELLLDVNVTGLLPDLEYGVNVVAFNQAGRGMDGSPLTRKTGQEVAENLKRLTVTFPAPDSLNVTWTPGVRTGPTNYSVTWAEETSLGSNVFNETGSTLVQGYDNRTYTIPGLLSYWNYKVSVHPIASLGQSPSSTVTISRTLDTEPGEIEVFIIAQPSDSAQTLQLTVSCPEERKRNGPITAIYYNSTIIGDGSPGPSGKLLQMCPTVSEPVTVTFKAETNYTINVFAFTSTNKTGRLRSKTVHVEPKAPKLTQAESIQKSTEPASLTSYDITVCRCLANSLQGKITFVSLVVCKDDKNDCEPAATEQDYRSLTTWKEFKDGGYRRRYRPTPDDWIASLSPAGSRRKRSVQSELQRVARAVSEAVGRVEYSIGSDTTCDPAAKRSYCNGPLPPDTQLFVYAVACTRGGCSATGLISITTLPQPPENGVNVGAIVGGIIAALVVITIIVVVIFVIRRKTRGGSSTSAPFEDSLLHRKCLPVILFPARVEILHQHSDHPFRQECQELVKSSLDNFTCDVGKLEINMIKNRNADILPYDHTRVKLFTRDDRNQDYINASYVSGPQSPCQYIATQAPLISTVPDFWKMVCEQKSQVIVMVADLAENDQMGRYWPSVLNSPAQFGDVTIRVTSSSDLPTYTVRKIAISTMSETTQKVTHIQLSHWRNQVCALPLEDVADIIQVVTSYTRNTGQPVIVHCSNGSGRTGTLIALDILTRFVENHDVSAEVNVFAVLNNMMKCRLHLIQSETQYMFIHDVLRVVIDRKLQDGRGKGKVYQNIGITENVYDSTEVYSTIPDANPYEPLRLKGQITSAL